MSVIRVGDKEIQVGERETILDALLKAGFAVGNSCRIGACQSCLVRATVGTPPKDGQRGLKSTLQERGYFLSCITRGTVDLTVAIGEDEGMTTPAQIVDSTRLSSSVLRLRLRPDAPLAYRAGQFVQIVRGDGLVRSYSLASVPGLDDFLELHIRLVPDGRMSGWLAERPIGERLTIRGPAGDCFYVAGQPEQPLLLAATGTGLAPLVGILRDALSHGHTGPISLLHGSREAAGLYLTEELHTLAAQHPQVSFVASVIDGDAQALAPQRITVATMQDLTTALFPALAGWRVFLCGDPLIVNGMRRQVFMTGVSRKDILADAFVMAPVRPAATP